MVKKILSSPILISTIVFLFCAILVVSLTSYYFQYDPEFLKNVLVEAHGMLFDILVIGILILWLNRRGEKEFERKRNIQRYQEEIEDYLGWDEKEAMYRIVGNIRRLNRLEVGDINLQGAYLEGADLWGVYLRQANLQEANLREAALQKADIQEAVLEGATLVEANLRRTNLAEANLYNANLYGAHLKGANLRGANLEIADLTKADFSGTNLKSAYFWGTELQETLNLTLEQLSEVETLYQAKLDPELEAQVKEKYPHLLEEPKEEE
ncbi:MAG: hypothetical protein CV087_11180 [Candidatus Brocadia sp. WS118]|nr:MAG: hypothetical protein CV087_11180 [Candidatus Brocadia sp. WS118]